MVDQRHFVCEVERVMEDPCFRCWCKQEFDFLYDVVCSSYPFMSFWAGDYYVNCWFMQFRVVSLSRNPCSADFLKVSWDMFSECLSGFWKLALSSIIVFICPLSDCRIFVFGLNESLPLFCCLFILVLVLLTSRRTLFKSGQYSWGAFMSSLESIFSWSSIEAFSEETSLK